MMSTEVQPNNNTSDAAAHDDHALSDSNHADEGIIAAATEMQTTTDYDEKTAQVELQKTTTKVTDPEKQTPADSTHQLPEQEHTSAQDEDDFHRTASTIAPSHRSVHRDPMSRVTTDAEGNTYPEGGLEAWLVVLGSFLGLFGSLGLLNTIGTLQAYIESHQLKDYSSGSIGWIFGMYAFLTFFCGVQIGPIFDAQGPRFLVLAGSICEIAMIILLSFCTKYWHFMLTIGVLGGVGVSLIFTPAIAAIGHYFYARRGLATGIAATGGSVGGIAFPLILQALFPKIGWGWATRVIALICLIAFGFANLLIKSRLPKKEFSKENVLPDFRIFRDIRFTLTTASVFFIEWGLFVPISYISSYALAHGFSTEFSYQILAILNVGSFFGRSLPGFFADFLGRFNALIVTVALCLLCNACLWLPAGNSLALLVIYALVFGFASGSNISLTPVCVGQLCKTEHYGRYYATAYTVVSFG
jgi:MFS family permease